MWEIFFLLAAVLLAAGLSWVVFGKKKAAGVEPVTFVCGECGEKDCICHRQAPDES